LRVLPPCSYLFPDSEKVTHKYRLAVVPELKILH
jgi:hypothetical protein